MLKQTKYMKAPDPDKLRCEKPRTLADFCEQYNAGLPESFTKASVELLSEYRRKHPEAFRHDGMWSLDQHRKKIMDWLPVSLSRSSS